MKVLVTRKIPENGLKKLRSKFDVILNEENRNLDYSEIKDLSRDVFGIVSMVSDKIDEEIIKNARNLKIIANYGVGINNVDIRAATKKGIFFTNTPDVLTEATAELGFTLILSLARNVTKADKFTREGKFTGFDPVLFLGQELYGKTIGIIGMGRIGSQIARIARFGFNMNVLYYNRNQNSYQNIVDAKRVEFEELLRESNVIVVSAPLNDKSKYMISYSEFDVMRDDAIFVNIGRGEIVNTDALIEKAKRSPYFKVGLDVYENEPNFDSRLFEIDNCILLPHIGSATFRARQKMSYIVAKNIIKTYEGGCPDFVINGGQLCNASD